MAISEATSSRYPVVSAVATTSILIVIPSSPPARCPHAGIVSRQCRVRLLTGVVPPGVPCRRAVVVAIGGLVRNSGSDQGSSGDLVLAPRWRSIVVWLAKMVGWMPSILGDHSRTRTGRTWRWCRMPLPPRRFTPNQKALRSCRSRLCVRVFDGRVEPYSCVCRRASCRPPTSRTMPGNHRLPPPRPAVLKRRYNRIEEADAASRILRRPGTASTPFLLALRAAGLRVDPAP
jgi:hypothetical protein